jgi:hypothetical protein
MGTQLIDPALHGVEADIDAFDFVHQGRRLGRRHHTTLASIEQP